MRIVKLAPILIGKEQGEWADQCIERLRHMKEKMETSNKKRIIETFQDGDKQNMREEEVEDHSKIVPKAEIDNPKYCPAGNCLCDHIRVRDKTQEANSKLCTASCFNSADPQCVDKWEMCPIPNEQKYTDEPYEEAFTEWQRKITPTTSVNMAASIFKEVMAKYFAPKVK